MQKALITRLIALTFFFYTGDKLHSQNTELVLPGDFKGSIFAGDISPNGKWLATGTSVGEVKLWDLISGKQLKTFKNDSDMTVKVLFSPDGKQVLSHWPLILWDRTTGLRQYLAKDEDPFDFCFSPNNKFIYISAAKNKELLIIDRVTNSITKRVPLFDNPYCIRVSADGNLLAGDMGSEVWIWNTTTWEVIEKIPDEGAVTKNKFNFIPGTNQLLIQTDKKIINWDYKKHVAQINYPAQNGYFTNFALIPGTKQFVTSSSDSLFIYWELSKNKPIRKEKTNFYTDLLLIDPEGKKIVYNDYFGREVIVANIDNFRKLATLGGSTQPISSLDISSDGNKLAILNKKYIRIWDLNQQKNIVSIPTHLNYVYSVRFSPDGKYVAYGTPRNDIIIADIARGDEIYRLTGDQRIINSLAFSPDNKLLASGGEDSSLYIWDLEARKPIVIQKKLHSPPHSMSFSSDGMLLAVAHWIPFISLYDAHSGTSIKQFNGTIGPIETIHFSKGDRRLYFDMKDSVIRYWDIVTDKWGSLTKMDMHGIRSSIIEPERNLFISGDENGNLIFQNGSSDLQIKSKPHANNITSLVLAEKQGLFISSSTDNTVKFHNLKTGELVATLLLVDSIDQFLVLPDNNYSGTKRAISMVNFRKDNVVYPFEQFDLQYNRPHEVYKALGVKDTALLTVYKRAWEKRMKRAGIKEEDFTSNIHVPQIRLLNEDNIPANTNSNKLTLQLNSTDDTYFLDHYKVLVNDVPIAGRDLRISGQKSHENTDSISIELSNGLNKIQVSVNNEKGTESPYVTTYIEYRPNAPTPAPATYFIGIGVSNYKDDSRTLRYADKDIRDLAALFKSRYPDLKIDTLLNKKATKENILQLKEKLSKTKVDDRVIISVSGHGILSDSLDFYYATYDMDFEKPSQRGILFQELEALLSDIPSRKKLLLIDACNSGEIDKEDPLASSKASNPCKDLKTYNSKGGKMSKSSETTTSTSQNSFVLMQELFADTRKSNGAIVISAAAGSEYALEDSKWKNGVFTYSFKKAFQENPKNYSVGQLKEYLIQSVYLLTCGRQKPTVRVENLEFNWNIW
ncbi:MAG: caspase family protein [Chitinophagaceae bacterium]|nr:caspase family protein [Chitinophagaceae bacterium]